MIFFAFCCCDDVWGMRIKLVQIFGLVCRELCAFVGSEVFSCLP